MASILATVADAVAAELNLDPLTNFGRMFCAERSYAHWDMQLEDADTLHVDVVPVGIRRSELEDRGHLNRTCDFDVGVRQRFGGRDHEGRFQNTDIDGLVELMEGVLDFLASNNGRRLSTYTDASWIEEDARVTYFPEHLRTLSQFTGILRVSYEVYVEL